MHLKINILLLTLCSLGTLQACQNIITFKNETYETLTVKVMWGNSTITTETISPKSSDTIEIESSFNQIKARASNGQKCQSVQIARPTGSWKFIFHTCSGSLDVLTGKI